MHDVTTPESRRAEAVADLAEHTMYELLGGEAGIRDLVDRFYGVMDSDAAFHSIRRMHKADLSPMRQSLFEYLSGWLGGPPLFVERTGSPCITHAHSPYTIGVPERDQWLACMAQAMVDAEVPEKYRELLMPAFSGVADMLRSA